MKLLSILLLLFSILAFAVSLSIYTLFTTPVNTFEVYSSVSISNQTGFGIDLNSSVLSFGVLGYGSSSLRKVILTNDFPFPLVVKVDSIGDISKVISYDSRVYLPSFSNISIPITAFSEDRVIGFYEGNVSFKLFRTTDKLFNS